MNAAAVTQTIILAAGNGSRLGSHASGVPKPLVQVAGLPLIAHALRHAEQSGCSDAVIVTGYESERVTAAVEALHTALRVSFVHNPDTSLPNGVSLLSAAPLAGPLFFLQMVDHVFASPSLPGLTAAPLATDEDGRVLVDESPRDLDLEDATKVRLNGRRVSAIGKGISPWDAIDAGCFVLTPAIFDALRLVTDPRQRTVSSGMRRLVESGRLGAATVKARWVDVDTPADHGIAERLLGRG
jgi:choline kinase